MAEWRAKHNTSRDIWQMNDRRPWKFSRAPDVMLQDGRPAEGRHDSKHGGETDKVIEQRWISATRSNTSSWKSAERLVIRTTQQTRADRGHGQKQRFRQSTKTFCEIKFNLLIPGSTWLLQHCRFPRLGTNKGLAYQILCLLSLFKYIASQLLRNLGPTEGAVDILVRLEVCSCIDSTSYIGAAWKRTATKLSLNFTYFAVYNRIIHKCKSGFNTDFTNFYP